MPRDTKLIEALTAANPPAALTIWPNDNSRRESPFVADAIALPVSSLPPMRNSTSATISLSLYLLIFNSSLFAS
jgi:hypothetical protein